MKTICEKINEKITGSTLWNFYFGGMKAGVLDIETTGLNPERNKFILGCITDDREGQLYQMLAENRMEEDEALDEYMNKVSELDVVVTYNGRHFDIPFIEKRLKKYGYDDVYMPYNLDVYLAVNGYSPIRKLVPNLKQKTLENYMGFWMNREDEISGAESVELYNMYEKTGDGQLERKILLHNNDDVRQLTRLTEVLRKCDFHRAMYGLGFPVNPGNPEASLMNVQKIRIYADCIVASGRQLVRKDRKPVEYRSFPFGEMSAETEFCSADKSFRIRVPVMRRNGIAAADIRALEGLDEEKFMKYPLCEEGFIVVEDKSGLKYREINHLVKEVIRSAV